MHGELVVHGEPVIHQRKDSFLIFTPIKCSENDSLLLFDIEHNCDIRV